MYNFNTLFNLLTQDEQVRCFENVAAHLTEDGVFVIEGGVPTEFCRLRNNQYVDVEALAVDGEQLYFSLISTGQRYDRPEDAPPMTLAEMMAAVRATSAGLIEWAPYVQAEQLDGEGKPKTILLTQAINHATEHRAQIMAILTQLGVQPPELDGWTYFDEREK